ncbi:MAG: efflux RND transporter periplasmic adaptor subunit [Magnetococcales bacterium]|nr:efflux RND transporter periplasmic adaptor subunit [Magnetococcales bacterium]
MAQESVQTVSTKKFTCPMHPHYIAEAMGACPICGMDLVPMATADEGEATGSDQRQGVVVPAETIQTMGVRLGRAEMTSFGREMRAYGLVTENSRLETILSGRVEGWIETLKVTAIGDIVRRGRLLFTLYSPDLVVAQQDYLDALAQGSKARIAVSRQRLKSLGVQAGALATIRKKRRVLQRVPVHAVHAGRVSKLAIRAGSYIKPGMSLITIQDYRSVWLMASVPEKDLPFISRKTVARVTFPNRPGAGIRTTVDYIYPTIDASSRTGQVRLVIPNPKGVLRPGAYADVVFEVDVQKRLAIPSESILMDSDGPHVVLSSGEGRFEPRTVRTGLETGGRTEILEGIKAGEDVVISGQFLLDSESALRESFTKLQRLQTPLSLLSLTKGQMAMVDHLVDAALYVHESLADGFDMDPKFLQASREIKALLWSRFGKTQLGFLLDGAERAVGRIQQARTDTEILAALNDLTATLKPWILEAKPEHYQSKGLILFQDDGNGRLWMQLDDDAYNPYGDGTATALAYPESKQQASDTPASSADEAAVMDHGEQK